MLNCKSFKKNKGQTFVAAPSPVTRQKLSGKVKDEIIVWPRCEPQLVHGFQRTAHALPLIKFILEALFSLPCIPSSNTTAMLRFFIFPSHRGRFEYISLRNIYDESESVYMLSTWGHMLWNVAQVVYDDVACWGKLFGPSTVHNSEFGPTNRGLSRNIIFVGPISCSNMKDNASKNLNYIHYNIDI